jgi:hypothetical protein
LVAAIQEIGRGIDRWCYDVIGADGEGADQ